MIAAIATSCLIALAASAFASGVPVTSASEDSFSMLIGGEVQVIRVGGEAEAEIELIESEVGARYRAGMVEIKSQLPEGYPTPTPPGAIEIKRYPRLRRAQVSGVGGIDYAASRGFWPLIQHLRRNNIPMTAPVEMEYIDIDQDDRIDRWTMSLVYASPDAGPAGFDEDVRVTDAAPSYFISIGSRGRLDLSDPGHYIMQLEAWLSRNADSWRRAGNMRTLGYNGPYVPASQQWWEVQLRVEPVRQD